MGLPPKVVEERSDVRQFAELLNALRKRVVNIEANPPSIAGDPQERAAATSTFVFNENFTGFTYRKIGYEDWGQNSFFTDGNIEGGAYRCNGNVGYEQLSYRVSQGATTSPWFLQFRAKYPTLTAGYANLGLMDGAIGNDIISITEWWDSSQTNFLFQIKKGGVPTIRVTSKLSDTSWHTFGIGLHGSGELRMMVDGVVVYAEPDLSVAPTVPLFIGSSCNTFLEPLVAWYSYGYMAP